MYALKRINEFATRLAATTPYTNVYGMARTVLALGTISTLLANTSYELFPNSIGRQEFPLHSGLRKFGLFNAFAYEHLEVIRWASILLLIVVAAGWRPRWTGLLHWWVTCSLFASSPLIDGGDQLSAILTGLLIPVTLGDGRKWHWSKPQVQSKNLFCQIWTLISYSFIWAIQLQMAVIYFNAGTAKLNVTEWINGTAVYYWFTHPVFGAAPLLKPVIVPLVTNAAMVVLLTWGSILFEIILFGAIFMTPSLRKHLLMPALIFHFLILVVHGLFSFFFAMAGGLLIYLRSADKPFYLFGKRPLNLKPESKLLRLIGIT